ncbi:MAG: S-layer homology domain-containing protein [Clostridia bacterium]|nr:S-layer homology domain-containing protein [Clostridia bacterium]
MKRTLFIIINIFTTIILITTICAYDNTSLIDKDVYRMTVGNTYSLSINADIPIFSTEGESVTVDSNGIITAVSPGVSTVSVRVGEHSDSVKVHVLDSDILPVPLYVKSASVDANIPRIAFLGDSITAGSHTDKRYYQFMTDKYNFTADGKGLSGSNIGGIGSSNQPSFIDRVSSINENTDLIFVFGGVNDFGQNKGDFNRFKTGVRNLIEALIDRFPTKQIVFSSPIRNGGYFSTSKNKFGNTLEEFVAEMEAACAEYNIPYFSSFEVEYLKDMLLYNESGEYIKSFDFQNPEYYGDGVHPNRRGHELLSEWFIKSMEDLGAVKIIDIASDWEFKYTDIDVNHKYYDAIDFVGRYGYMNGVSENEFAPDTALNRAMFVTILHRASGSEKINIQKFKDVKPGSYYSSAVAWASRYNIVNGTAPNIFDPDSLINHEQLAVILYRYLDFTNDIEAFDVEGILDENVSDWARDAYAYCVSKGFIDNGSDSKTPVTRAEAAYAIMQIYK